MAGLEDAAHGELLHPRHHTGRADRALRCDQRQSIALNQAQLVGQHPPDDDAEAAWRERGQAAFDHLPRHVGNLRLDGRHDAAHQCTAHRLVAGNDDLPGHEGCGPRDVVVATQLLGQRLPVQRAIDVVDLHMREHRQHPVADFLLEAVHHRHDDDECRHAQRDAGHRQRRDEGNEAVLLACALATAGVAQADEPFKG